MPPVTVLQAKSILSSLVRAVETGSEREIIITRNGRPVARLVPFEAPSAGPRLGVAKGVFTMPEDLNASNTELAALFQGKSDS